MTTTPQFLHLLGQSLSAGDRVQFTLSASTTGIDLVLIPTLGDTPKDLTDEAAALRAALAMPLVVKDMDPATLDAAMTEHYEQYDAARRHGKTALSDLLGALQDATAGAKNKAKEERSAPAPAAAKPGKAPLTTGSDQTTPPTTADTPAKPAGGVLDF